MRRAAAWRQRTFALLVALLVSATTPPASAHHSIAMFDGKRVVKITGTVTGFRWINPHVSIRLDVAEGEAPGGPWIVEMQAPTTLMSDGWARDSLSAGDRITLFINPTRDGAASSGPHQGLYVGAILQDGRTLGRVDGSR